MVTQTKVRINKYIAQSGVASRRKADELIKDGQVRINGQLVKDLGVLVDPSRDSVKVGRKLIKPVNKFVYYKFNKPTSVLSTVNDPEDRKTVMNYFMGIQERIFPVGRLDWDSEGLLLLTNDGEFAQKVAHPSQKIPKTYLVKVAGNITDQKLQKLRNGVTIPGGRVQAILVEKVPNKDSKYQWLKIIIAEGKNRQIRYMMEKIDCDVKKLQRVAIGMLKLGKLKKGQYQQLSDEQVEKVFYKFKPQKLVQTPKRKKKVVKKKKKTQNVLSKKEFFKRINKNK
ncbi:MAG: rRNA pseudouridine synthase [Bdellovibrionales bacterium]|nr:rRNA pseudouridine synthase [Bdellovibrionales bacterium]